ncbi:MAG: carboxypeptidase regulatory-like domain-containing protein [Terracidiphilus sp.]|nr:carboxypeptidase regulatory-like domain-containing protein [Terracidiphilus sp.]
MYSLSIRLSSVLLSIVALLLATSAAWAQGGATGALQGVVRDSTGAVIAGASVQLVELSTGVVRTQQTTGDGAFNATLLPAGHYKVTVKATGFAGLEVANVEVRVTETSRLSLALKPASVSTDVIVDSGAGAIPQVNTTDATTGETVTTETIATLPLATRNFQQLLTLSSGASSSLNANASLGRGDQRINVNGQREDNNNYLIEGITASDANVAELTNTPLPSPDAVAEFRVQTSLYDATQGRNGGGNINAILKTGTNHLHGSAFEFFRNDVLNANDWFLKSQGQSRPVVKQNIFGGSVGGPFAKDGKYGFFFVNYQGTRQSSGLSSGTIIQSSIPQLPADRTAQSLVDTFFPASSYPDVAADLIDPVALKLLNFRYNQFGGSYLLPTAGAAPGTTVSGGSPTVATTDFAYSRPGHYDDDQVTVTYDKSLFNNRDTISARFFLTNFESVLPFGAGGLTASFGGAISRSDLNFPLDLPVHDRFLSVGETHVLSPALVNEARFGYVRIRNNAVNTPIVTADDLGINRPNNNVDQLSYKFTFNSLGINVGPTPGANQFATQDNFTVLDTASWTLHQHTLRFGGEYDRVNLDKLFPQVFNGQLFFSPVSGGPCGDVGCTDFQSFLLGEPSFSYGGSGVFNHEYRTNNVSLFAQDDYRVNQRLTLNLGVRYEVNGAFYDLLDHIGNTHADLARTGKSPYVYPKGINRYNIAGLTGTESETTLDNNYSLNWAPRVGFALDLFGDQSTSVRGGYGIYYVKEDVGNVDQLSFVPPILPMTFPSGSLDSLTNLFAVGGGQLPVGGVIDPAFVPTLSRIADFPGGDTTQAPNFTGTSINFLGLEVPRKFVSPSTQQWNLTVERNLRHGWVGKLGYVGTKSTHLRETRDAIQAYDVRNNPVAVTGTDGNAYTITENTLNNVNARSRAIGLGVGGYQLFADDANAEYHSLQVVATHHYANGLQVETAYSWSKTIDETSTASTAFNTAVNDQTSLKDSHGLSDFDRKHRLTIEYLYELPFFKTAHGLAKTALSGWTASGVTTFQSGTPFTVLDSGAASAYGLAGTGTPTTPDLVGTVSQGLASGNLHSRVRSSYLNYANFTPAPAVGSDGSTGFGNLGRNTYRGPFQQNWDFSLRKNFALAEKAHFEFTADFFNLFNHPIFSSPSFVDVESASNFGEITSTQGSPRLVQFSGRFSF